MSYHVKRTRTADDSASTAMGFRDSQVGRVQFSRTFPTQRAAEREANAWESTGEWQAEVIEGKAPRAKPTN